MARTLDTLETTGHPSGGTPAFTTRRGPLFPYAAPAFVVGVAAAGAAIVELADTSTPSQVRWAGTVVVVVWGLAGLLIGLRRRRDPLGLIVSGVAVLGAAVLAGSAHTGSGNGRLRDVATALLIAVLFHLAVSLPDGRVASRTSGIMVLLAYAAGIVIGLVESATEDEIGVPTIVFAAVLTVIGLVVYANRGRKAGAVERARLQWAGWGVVVALMIVLVGEILHVLLDWPDSPGAIAVAASALIPLSLTLSSWDTMAIRIDRLLVHTIVGAGLVAIVAVVYLIVVLGLGDAPDDQARDLLGLSMVAAALAAIVALPARRSLDEMARRRVYGERRSPDEAIQTFGSRMSRAVPMDELLLQLAESLKLSMQLVAAEVWTGTDGVLDRVVSVPDRGPRRLVLSSEELPVVARARVSGNAWLQVWVPSLIEDRGDAVVRVAPVVHSGILLGLIVAERSEDSVPFTDESERVLTELARQVGLALHNVRLDSALQASLETLQERNQELAASRLRIVTAADESRRQIERNLHDGAQQHLVALAVKVGLARQLVESDPATVSTMLEELRGDVQATLGELRELAHGIYPPLLRDRGLAEALRTAANRAVLPTEVVAQGIERYPSETEAAVYFCCLEAMQNAGKHAGEDAAITVTITATDTTLDFTVADTGPGFDATVAVEGHGFVNMRDRLGAVGGMLTVDSDSTGTRIGGHIPLDGGLLTAAAYDAVVVGSGPNGLVAAVTLARVGWKVLVVEAKSEPGGGTRSAELTLPGVVHDVCSAIHPLALGSKALRDLPLADHGLEWIHPDVPLAHPLDGGRAAVLRRSVDETSLGLGPDGDAWRKLMGPFVRQDVVDGLLDPLRIPRAPIPMARYGLVGIQSASSVGSRRFDGDEAKALFGGCAAHAMLDLKAPVTAGYGIMIAALGHLVGWPMAKGGSSAIAAALVSLLEAHGGEVECGRPVHSLDELPPARAVLLDVTPRQVVQIAGERLPDRYRKRLESFRYGPGVWKVDWALDGPTPWTNPECSRAGTVHLGGTLPEMVEAEGEVQRGRHPERPYVLFAQQTPFDPTRAPEGMQTAWAYCHVPSGSEVDMTARIEAQVERFAPGFRDRILARHVMGPGSMELHDANYIGGDINGGVGDFRQFVARPVLSLHPWATPVPGLYLCSSSTPPGGGVHGMCGYLAAQTVLRREL